MMDPSALGLIVQHMSAGSRVQALIHDAGGLCRIWAAINMQSADLLQASAGAVHWAYHTDLAAPCTPRSL